MEEDYLKKLVKRYLEKKSTDQELEIFVHLMKEGKLDQYIQDAMNDDIDATQQISLDPKSRNTLNKFRWSIAATVAVAMGVMAYQSLYKPSSQTFARIGQVYINNLSSTTYKQVLPDRSTVWMNPHTTLSYPSKFGNLREVKMRGEAFFEVTKNHAHPFVIISGEVLTKVWGTSFRIRSIPGEINTQVSVLTGKVSVSIPKKGKTVNSLGSLGKEEVLLLPQEEANYKETDHHILKAPIPAGSDVIIWRKANLAFENTSLSAIARELNKYYHVQIQIEGSELQQNKLTADFTDKNLADILVLICKSVHTTYSTENNKIILRTTELKPISIN